MQFPLKVRIGDALIGTSIVQSFYKSIKQERFPREKITELQNNLLMKMIRFACENVPHYKRMFRKLNISPSDIKEKKRPFQTTYSWKKRTEGEHTRFSSKCRDKI